MKPLAMAKVCASGTGTSELNYHCGAGDAPNKASATRGVRNVSDSLGHDFIIFYAINLLLSSSPLPWPLPLGAPAFP